MFSWCLKHLLVCHDRTRASPAIGWLGEEVHRWIEVWTQEQPHDGGLCDVSIAAEGFLFAGFTFCAKSGSI